MFAGVFNFTQVDATVACAGEPPGDAFAMIAARGFVSVVNLRMDHAGLKSPVIIEFVGRFLDARG